MNIIKEINRLPNFGYVFCGDDGREHLAILGGHSSLKTERYEWAKNIFDISYRMQDIYSNTDLSEADKTKLAQLMNKMHSLCESRKAGLFTIDEQEKYLNERSEAELKQIEKQVKMHLDCRAFYHEYIHKK